MQTDDNKWHEGDPEREGRGLVHVCPECHQSRRYPSTAAFLAANPWPLRPIPPQSSKSPSVAPMTRTHVVMAE
jgi:hypothetical protein